MEATLVAEDSQPSDDGSPVASDRRPSLVRDRLRASVRRWTSRQISFPSFPRLPNRKPVFVLLLSGQQYGYLSAVWLFPDPVGGLERRFNLIQQLRRIKIGPSWPWISATFHNRAGRRKLLKYVTSMEALKRLDYAAVGVGENEFMLHDRRTGLFLSEQPNK